MLSSIFGKRNDDRRTITRYPFALSPTSTTEPNYERLPPKESFSWSSFRLHTDYAISWETARPAVLRFLGVFFALPILLYWLPYWVVLKTSILQRLPKDDQFLRYLFGYDILATFLLASVLAFAARFLNPSLRSSNARLLPLFLPSLAVTLSYPLHGIATATAFSNLWPFSFPILVFSVLPFSSYLSSFVRNLYGAPESIHRFSRWKFFPLPSISFRGAFVIPLLFLVSFVSTHNIGEKVALAPAFSVAASPFSPITTIVLNPFLLLTAAQSVPLPPFPDYEKLQAPAVKLANESTEPGNESYFSVQQSLWTPTIGIIVSGLFTFFILSLYSARFKAFERPKGAFYASLRFVSNWLAHSPNFGAGSDQDLMRFRFRSRLWWSTVISTLFSLVVLGGSNWGIGRGYAAGQLFERAPVKALELAQRNFPSLAMIYLSCLSIMILTTIAWLMILIYRHENASEPAEEFLGKSIALESDWVRLNRTLNSEPSPLTAISGEAIELSKHVYIGEEPFQKLPILLDTTLLTEHCHILGDSGSGKSSLGVMPLIASLLEKSENTLTRMTAILGTPPKTHDAPIVVIDLKGDRALFQGTRALAERHGRAFKFFSSEAGQASYTFCPFLQFRDHSASISEVCQLFLDALNLNHGEGYGRSYFSRQGRDLLMDALASPEPPRSFGELYEAVSRLSKADPKRRSDAFELIATIKALATYPQLEIPSSQNSDISDSLVIHMPTVLEKREVIYFYLPSAIESVATKEIAKLALYCLLNSAVQRQKEDLEPIQSFVFIDEFQRIAAENFKVVLQQARSFGIGLIMANQTMADLVSADSDLRDTVHANTRVKMYFSVTNPTDAERIARSSGEELRLFRNRSVTVTENAAGLWSSGDTSSSSEVFSTRLSVQDILFLSDHPRRFIFHASRGSGMTQFGGLAVPAEASWIMSFSEYQKLQRLPWPSEPKLPPRAKGSVKEEATNSFSAKKQKTGSQSTTSDPYVSNDDIRREYRKHWEEALKDVEKNLKDNPWM